MFKTTIFNTSITIKFRVTRRKVKQTQQQSPTLEVDSHNSRDCHLIVTFNVILRPNCKIDHCLHITYEKKGL